MKTFAILLWAALATLLGAASGAAAPDGWSIAGSRPADFDFGTDTQTVYEGASGSGYIKAKVAPSTGFGTLMQRFNADHYRGTRLRLSGYLKTDQAQRAQMWLRIDGPANRVLGFDNMESRPIVGTVDWRRYEIVLDVPPTATNIAFGFFLFSAGAVWADGFKFEKVDASVPLTVQDNGARYDEPQNLNFDKKSP